MSKIIEILRHEHDEISLFISKLREMCKEFMEHNKIDISEFRKSVEFIKEYADGRHHQKEEQILFKAMTEHIGRQAENLIKYGMLIEHDLARYHVNSLEEALNAYEKDKSIDNKLDIISYAAGYYHLLQRHIYKENNVVYPFGEKNLSKEIMEQLDKEAVEYELKYNK